VAGSTVPGLDAAASGRKLGVLWGPGRAVWVLAGVAVVGLIVGFVLGGLVKSPGEAGRDMIGPAEGLITAQVEAREITATVVARADVAFSDPVLVTPSTPEGTLSAVVTGAVPEAGAEINAGDVILEVSGRPVFVLPGGFKAYRTMGSGTSGPDVAQLRAALQGLGFNAGTVGAETYDADLAVAVKACYDKAGYAAPGSEDPALARAVRDASDGLTEAQEAAGQANKELAKAQAVLQTAVDAYAAIKNGPGKATAKEAVIQAQEVVDAAQMAATGAGRAVARAEQSLSDAQRAAWTQMPVGEVVFVDDLPRRVDQVNVMIGDDLAALASPDPTGPAGEPVAPVVLSGAEIKVTAQVSAAEGELLKVGGPAVLTLPGAGEVTGEITTICDKAALPDAGSQAGQGGGGQAGGEQCPVGIKVVDFGDLSQADLVGNLQVTMTVGTSAEGSLVVPVAAVAANTAGEAQITVIDGDLIKGGAAKDQATKTVKVEVGLSAEGMVEIKSAEPNIKAGDLVVVGQGAAGSSPGPPG